MLFGKILEIGKALHHVLITDANHFVHFKNLFLRAEKLAADAVELLFLAVIEHVNVQIPHKAGGAAVVQSAFRRLSHVVKTSFC